MPFAVGHEAHLLPWRRKSTRVAHGAGAQSSTWTGRLKIMMKIGRMVLVFLIHLLLLTGSLSFANAQDSAPAAAVDVSSSSQYRDPSRIAICKEGMEVMCEYRDTSRMSLVEIKRSADASGMIEVEWVFDRQLCDIPAQAMWCRVRLLDCDKPMDDYKYFQCTDWLPDGVADVATDPPVDDASYSSPKWNMAGQDNDWKNKDLLIIFVCLIVVTISVFAFYRFYHRYKHFGNFKEHPEDPTHPQEAHLFNDPRTNVDSRNSTFMRNFFSLKMSREHGVIDPEARQQKLKEQEPEKEEEDSAENFLFCLSIVCCCFMTREKRAIWWKWGKTQEELNGETVLAELERQERAEMLGGTRSALQAWIIERMEARRNARRNGTASPGAPGDRDDSSRRPSISSFGSSIPPATRKWVGNLFNNSQVRWFYKTRDGGPRAQPYAYDYSQNKSQLVDKVARQLPPRPAGNVRVLKGLLSSDAFHRLKNSISPERDHPTRGASPGAGVDHDPYHSVPVFSPVGSPAGMKAGGSPLSPTTRAKVVESDLVVEDMMATRKDLLFSPTGASTPLSSGGSPEEKRMRALDRAAKGKMSGKTVPGNLDTFVSSDVTFDTRGGWVSPENSGSGKWRARNTYRVEKIRHQLEERELRKEHKRAAFEAEVERQQHLDEERERNRVNLNRMRREQANDDIADVFMKQTAGGSFKRQQDPHHAVLQQVYGQPSISSSPPVSPTTAGGRSPSIQVIHEDEDREPLTALQVAKFQLGVVESAAEQPPKMTVQKGDRISLRADEDKKYEKMLRFGERSLPIIDRGGRAVWEVGDLAATVPKKAAWEDADARKIASMVLPTYLAPVKDPRLLRAPTEDELFMYEKHNYAAAKYQQYKQESFAQKDQPNLKGKRNLADAKAFREAFEYQHVFKNMNPFHMKQNRPETSPVKQGMIKRQLKKLTSEDKMKRDGGEQSDVDFSINTRVNDPQSIPRRWQRVEEEAALHHIGAARNKEKHPRLKQLNEFEREFGNESANRPKRGFVWPRRAPELHEYEPSYEDQYPDDYQPNLYDDPIPDNYFK
ncbi:unnamed protein product [Amoebophrya sp. A120]|nr:unnamed protein product [Amoebophrya sp. A120]|eukprot:GSA120T00002568001.1